MSEPTKKRGRTATGNALSNAERQRRYIERLKAQSAPAPAPAPPAPDADLSRQLAEARAEITRLNAEGDKLFLKIDQMNRGIASRESKITDLSKRLDAAVHERDAAKAGHLEAAQALAMARETIKSLERELKRIKR